MRNPNLSAASAAFGGVLSVRSAAGIALLSLTLACGGGGSSPSPTSPTAAAPAPTATTPPATTTPTATSRTFRMSFDYIVTGGGQSTGAFSAQVDGTGPTYTALGVFTVTLPEGVHTIAGTFLGGGIGVSFLSSNSSAGVLSGSVQSLEGPAPSVGNCRVSWGNGSTPATQRTFRLQFTVTGNATSTCQNGS